VEAYFFYGSIMPSRNNKKNFNFKINTSHEFKHAVGLGCDKYCKKFTYSGVSGNLPLPHFLLLTHIGGGCFIALREMHGRPKFPNNII